MCLSCLTANLLFWSGAFQVAKETAVASDCISAETKWHAESHGLSVKCSADGQKHFAGGSHMYWCHRDGFSVLWLHLFFLAFSALAAAARVSLPSASVKWARKCAAAVSIDLVSSWSLSALQGFHLYGVNQRQAGFFGQALFEVRNVHLSKFKLNRAACRVQ